ncbi:MAG: hypothetical protein ACI4QZ_04460 [Eubacteriales bacterium]
MKVITFMTSLLTFYLKGEIKVEQNFLQLQKPNTILALIPLGKKKESIPVTQISSVESNFKLILKNFIVGIFVAILGIGMLSDNALGLILLLLGAGIVINSFQTVLTIQTTAGASKEVSFLIFEKSKVAQAEAWINDIISGRLDDTNNRIQGDRQTDRVVEAINSLNKSQNDKQ